MLTLHGGRGIVQFQGRKNERVSQESSKANTRWLSTELVTESTENTAGCLVASDIPRKNIWKYNDRGESKEFNCLPLIKVHPQGISSPILPAYTAGPSRQLLGGEN